MSDAPPPTPGDGPRHARENAAGDPGAVTPMLPSPLARLVGVLAIVAAGAAGGFIGFAVTDLTTTGDNALATGIGGLVGAIIAAVGVGIVVQLALRAMNEWRAIEARGGPAAERQRQRASERRRPPTTRPRPRVK